MVEGLDRLGMRMLVEDGHRIWNLNTPRTPDGVRDTAVRNYLMDNYGIEVLGGFGPLAGQVFRIGLMGPLATPDNVDMFLDAFARALKV